MFKAFHALGGLAFCFPILCVWVPYSTPLLLAVINLNLLWLLKKDYFRIKFSKQTTFLLGICFAWMVLSSLWSVNQEQSLGLCFSLLALTILAATGTSSMAKLDKEIAKKSLKYLYWGAVVACLCLIVEVLSYRTVLDNSLILGALNFPKHPIAEYNRAITLVVLFLPIFFYGRPNFIVPTGLFAGLVVASFYFDYDAGCLALWLLPIVWGLFTYAPRQFIRALTSLAVVLVLTAPLISKHVLNYETWRTYFTTQNDVSWLHRLQIWSYVADKIHEKPVLGWGLNSSRSKVFQQKTTWILPGKDMNDQGTIMETSGVSLHPHNMSLQIWLELGGVGALLTALVFMAIGRGLQSIFPFQAQRDLAMVFATGLLIAHLSYGFWQNWWYAALGFIFIWSGLIRASEGVMTRES